MSVGKNLLNLLYDHKMTQRDLAEKVGCDPTQISKIVNGNRVPKMELAVKIAEAFEVSLDELIKGKKSEV